MAQYGDLEVRWLIRKDLPDVLAIEKANFDNPWTEDDFIRTLRQRYSIGMIGLIDDAIVGFMIYSLHDKCLEIINLAIKPEYQRQSIATRMIRHLKDKLSLQRRNNLAVLVRETNLDAQLFFKAVEFKAKVVIRNHFSQENEDAYLMKYLLKEVEEQSSHSPVNRITQFIDHEM